MKKPLAVILGAGPVGQSVGQIFQSRGVSVRYVTRSGKPIEGAETRSADVRDAASLLKASEGATILVHAAGVNYNDWYREFPLMQTAVIDVAENTGAVLVLAENLYSYSTKSMPLKESSVEEPQTRKGALRLRLSQQWLDAHRSGRIKGVSIRASDYFGPRATTTPNSHFGARFFPLFVAGKPVSFLGNPEAAHCFTYLPDYARALVDVALDPSSWGRAWICPSMGPTTARTVAQLFGQAAAKKVKVGALPSWLVKTLGIFNPMIREVEEMLHQFERDFTVDASDFEAHFGWKSTALEQAVRETWADHQARG